MSDNSFDSALEQAREAAEHAQEYKSETYFAVLLATLLRPLNVSTSLRAPLASQATGMVSRAHPAKQYSASELFSSKNWSTEIDKALLAGFFSEKHSGVPYFTIKEIRNCLVAAKVTLPNNLSLAIRQAIQRGWMMEVPTEDKTRTTAFALTQKGALRVEQDMNKTDVR
jgi:hypothetical protein